MSDDDLDSTELQEGSLFALGSGTILVHNFQILMGVTASPVQCKGCGEDHGPQPLFIIDIKGTRKETHELVQVSLAMDMVDAAQFTGQMSSGLNELIQRGLL